MNPERKVCEAPSYHSLKAYFDYLRNELEMDINTRWCVESLSEYIDGYNHALFIHNIAETHSLTETTPSFNDWVAMKEASYDAIRQWKVIIEAVTASDKEGIQLFLQYYDEYVAREAMILFEHVISVKEIDQLISISRQSEEEKRRYIGCRVQIITYDATKHGVFERWIDQSGEDLYDQYILHASIDNALGALREKFRVNFEQHLHPFRISCAWEKMPMDLGVVKVVGQATKAGTLQMIRAEKGNINLSIDSSWDDEWTESLSGLESVAERIVELSVDPKLIRHDDLVPFINLKILHLAFGQPQSLPKLEALTSLYLANWNDDYAGILPECCPNLEHLDIGFFNGEDLLGLRQLTQLKYLTLRYGGLKSLAGMENLPCLEEVHISMLALENVTALQACPPLKILHVETHSELLESIDLSSNTALVELRIEQAKNLKNINLDPAQTYALEKIYLSGTKSLESLEWITSCPNLKQIGLSFKSSKAMAFDAAKLAELTSFYGDCLLNSFTIQRLLSNTSLQKLFLSKANAIHDFAWLTPQHQLRHCSLYFSGDAIDWDQLFSCLVNDWQIWQIECTRHLDIENTTEEIVAIAHKHRHHIQSIRNWTTDYPLYRF